MHSKKKLAGKVLHISPKKVRFAPGAFNEVVKAITRSDIRGLIAVDKITVAKTSSHSRGRARHLARQKQKGRRAGRGNKKGTKYSIVPRKEQWMMRVRVQRAFLQNLNQRDVLSHEAYRKLYNLIKGGYFRNKRHIKLYITEHQLIQRKDGGVALKAPSTKSI